MLLSLRKKGLWMNISPSLYVDPDFHRSTLRTDSPHHRYRDGGRYEAGRSWPTVVVAVRELRRDMLLRPVLWSMCSDSPFR